MPPLWLSTCLSAAVMVAAWVLLATAPELPLARLAAGLTVLPLLACLVYAVVANRRLKAELQRVEAELAERQRSAGVERLNAVGRVAGAVAHDFNNILTAVSGHAELARMRSDDPTIQDHLDHVLMAVQRAAELGRRLMSTARPPPAKLRPTDLAALTATFAVPLQASLPQQVTFALDTPPGGATALALADADLIKQMLMHLCSNAREAMGEGGRLVLRIAAVPGWIEISVSDTGCGIADEVRAHLFEPYTTTKGGRGAGLGLASVHAIVTQHQGSITVDTQPGRGSTFRVRLPAA